MKIIEGKLNGTGLKIAIIASRFNDLITAKLIEGAQDMLVRHGVIDDEITIYKVPGAFEIPQAAKQVVKKGGINAVICLGAVIRGETPHFNYVSAEVTKGIALVSMETNLPVVYGIITADNFDQAFDRAGGKAGNKGADAAQTAMEMASLHSQI